MHSNNSAFSAGALILVLSEIYIMKQTILIFINNTAINLGGAVYVDPDRFEFTSQDDYYYLLYTNCLYDTNSANTEQYFNFVNNVAQIAGNNIYGASVEWCSRSVVLISPKNSSLSSVSGNPLRVCRCDEIPKPLCRNISHSHFSLSYYPGETITISVLIVGGDWGATQGTVYARFQTSYSYIISPESIQPI